MPTPTQPGHQPGNGRTPAPLDARGAVARCCWCLEPIRDDDPDACHSGANCKHWRGARAPRAR